MIKLTFTGDIMCSALQNEACATKDKLYNYNKVFEPISKYLLESDYVCGNLETPIGDINSHLTDKPAVFNTPHPFLQALKDSGFHLLTTANNHVMDRGEEGIKETLKYLNQYKFDHVGTYYSLEESEKILTRNFTDKLTGDSIKVSFLSFTYGTNSEFHGNLITDEKLYMVDLLKRQPLINNNFRTEITNVQKIKKHIKKIIPLELLELYKSYITKNKFDGPSVKDNVSDLEIENFENKTFIDKLLKKIDHAKEQSDFVVCCLHCGGQYNTEIGNYTLHIHKLLRENGVDLIIGNHPHCIQQHNIYKNRLDTYSLGNFTFTPRDGWYIDGVLADYSILLHAYIDEHNKTICKYTFSLVKNIRKGKLTCTHLVYDLIQEEQNNTIKNSLIKENRLAIKRFTNKNVESIQKEYDLIVFS